MNEKRTLNLVQALRGVASLLVVLMHTGFTVTDTWHVPFFGNAFYFGGAGVDIFFVLSGFIITFTGRHSIGKPGQFSAFIRRRFVRIYPAYWIIISLFLIVEFSLPSFYRTLYPLSGGHLAATYLLLPGHIMVNGVSWTLSYELFFYLLFSLAFLVRNRYVIFFASLFFLITLIDLYATGAGPTEGSVAAFIFFPMNFEFFMGILIAFLVDKLSAKTARVCLITGAVLFLASAVATDTGHILIRNGLNRVVMFGIPSFFIICGVTTIEIRQKVNVHNVLVRLGEASYSLYLLHLPFVVAGIKIISRFIKNPGPVMIVAVIILVICICAASILFFSYVEKPVIKKLNHRKNLHRPLPVEAQPAP